MVGAVQDFTILCGSEQHPCPCALLPQGARGDPGISELLVACPGAPGGLAERMEMDGAALSPGTQ